MQILYFLSNLKSSVTQAEIEGYATSCMTEFKVSEKQMNDTQSGVTKPADVPENVKCSLKCFLEKMALLDPKTVKIIQENAKAKYPEIPKAAMDKCTAKQGSSPCDTAYQIVSCFWTEDAI